MKYKVGEKVRVVQCYSGGNFAVGDIVEIIQIGDDDGFDHNCYGAISQYDGMKWYLQEDEVGATALSTLQIENHALRNAANGFKAENEKLRAELEQERANRLHAEQYGREYGSGYCYLCQNCGAYVGTHKPRPREALGLLSNEPMRTGKKMCHALFDPLWQRKKKAHKKRNDLYRWLAHKMDIPVEDCHFGYFDIGQLRKAYIILRSVQAKQMKYDNCGRIYFEEPAHD